jgi:hypothetical protein
MVWVIAFGSPDSFVIDPKVYAMKFIRLIKLSVP